MKPLIIANWKMNLTMSEASKLTAFISNYNNHNNLIICPPTAYIAYLAKDYSKLSFGAQDVSIIGSFGPHTGENSAKILKSCGINYSIIGHSERRILFEENNATIYQKTENCLEHDITPIICIGENKQERKNNSYKESLSKQIKDSLPKTNKPIIIAYEPIWAIGTKITPSIEQISEIIELIKTTSAQIVAKSLQIVYGGSVNSENYQEITTIENLNGTLIGGASLNKEELFKILSF